MPNKRKPDNLLLLKGTYQKCRHGEKKTKPKIKTGKLVKPHFDNPGASKEWDVLILKLKDSKVLISLDTTVLTQYCMLYAEMMDKQEKFALAKHTALRMILIELGLTPSSRSKIVVPESNDEEF